MANEKEAALYTATKIIQPVLIYSSLAKWRLI